MGRSERACAQRQWGVAAHVRGSGEWIATRGVCTLLREAAIGVVETELAER